MKFYCAGKFEERKQVRELQEALKEKGHEISHDWTACEVSDVGYPAKHAIEDIWGIANCDCYVGIFIKPLRYEGTLIEMGAALIKGKKVYVIGRSNTSHFLGHPNVIRFDSVEEFMESV